MDLKILMDTFQKEADGWKQMLDCIIKENINLKIRLAGILTERIDQQENIERAEAYQTRFIQNDVIIGLIRHDIVEFQNELASFTNDGCMIKEIVDRKARLQREIISLQVAINDLKHHFNESIVQQGWKYNEEKKDYC